MRNKLHVAVLNVVLIMSGVAAFPDAVVAQAAAQGWQIPAGNLDVALRQFSAQSRVQLIYSAELVDGKRNAALSGSYAPDEALRRLLRGSGLVHEAVNATTIVIRRAPQAAAPAPQPAPARAATPAAEEDEPVELARLDVTGSRLKLSEVEGPQPLLIFQREEIERSGQSSVMEFLRTLPEVSGGQHVESSFGANPHAQTVQLRGLPTGRTLVLINGRRLPNSAQVDGGFANLNNIPIAAVERIDVLPQGASAVYGSDALAGVINIILRRDVDGLHLNTRFGAADGTSDRRASLVWGRAWERGALSLMADYYDRTPLFADERDRLDDVDYTRYRWRDLRGTTCNPGTVYSTDGGNLPGLDGPSAAIPQGLTGTPAIADFAGSGDANRCYVGASGLVYAATRRNAMASGDWTPGERVTLFAEASYSRLHHEYLYPYTLSNVLVPASNPYNPFGQDVRVSYLFSEEDMPHARSDIDTELTRVLLGARGDLGGDWQWEAAGWDSREKMYSNFVIPNASYAAPALSSTDPATALNLFASGAPASPQVLQAYRDDPAAYIFTQALAVRNATTTNRGGNVLFRGTLVALPAGPLAMALGGEYMKENFENVGSNRGDFEVGRDVKAVYGELRAPLLSRGGAAGSAELLTLSAAMRRDEYSDFGGATMPQLGLEWRPVGGLLIRAAYAEAFKAPDLFAVYGPQSGGALGSTLLDPSRNEELITGATYVAGGNPDLRPETGNSLSAGLIWSSERLSGFNLSVNWWRLEMNERISLFPSRQMILSNEDLFPGRVTRAAPTGDGLPGRVTQIDYTALNLGDIWVEGVDLGVDYRFDTAAGTWSPRLRATRYTRYDALLNPTVGVVDYLGNANNDIWVPRWRATLSLDWRLNAWSAGIAGRYVGNYRDYNPLDDGRYQRLGDFWVWDANLRWDTGRALAPDEASWLSGSYVSLGAVNLFDHQPEFAATTSPGYGWDGAQNDIRGRYAYIEFGLKF